MSTWCKGVALLAGWLALGGVARAQLEQFQYQPSPVGAARMPEPVPCGPVPPQPNLVPGPISPLAAPPVPLECTSLPAGHPSAFQCETFPPETAWYASIGAQALQRQGLGKGATAVVDPQNLDTGLTPPSLSPVAQRFEDIHPSMNWGIRGTIGYLWGNQALELTNFTIFQKYTDTQVTIPGRIDAFSSNPPLGFEGDNGLWLQADRQLTSFQTFLSSTELNYRVWNGGINHCELLLGVRYVRLHETLNLFTDDDGITNPDLNGHPDPTRQATYGVQTTNNIIASQFGFEYSAPLPLLKSIWFGGTGKVALGPNLINVNNTLTRGDGFSGFNTHWNTVGFGQVYEIGGFLDFHILERMRVRAGYNAVWLAGIAVPNDQIDYNLVNTAGARNVRGSALFHGPMIELQFLF